MKKITIGYDVDGTIADTDHVVSKILKAQHGIDVPRSRLDTYKLERDGIISHRRMIKIYKDAWKDPRAVPIMNKKIPRIIAKISKELGYESNIITCTAAKESVLQEWLDINKIPRSKTIHLKTAIGKGKFRGIHVHVDDHPDVAKAAARSGKVTILLKGPCSREFIKTNNDESIIVARNWKEVEEILRSSRIAKIRPQ